MGATHHARLHGIIPGYTRDVGDFMWLPKSDLLNPLEDALSWFNDTLLSLSGREWCHTFDIGQPIDADAQNEEVDNNAG